MQPWPATPLIAITALLADLPCPWVFCGGWAIDLWLGRQTRSHKDVDIAILRRDQQVARAYLRQRGWSLEIAYRGELTAWDDDGDIVLPRHIVWCRNAAYEPDFLEVLFNEANDNQFRYRNDRTIALPLLAPEIVLLYKSSGSTDAGNAAGFITALPRLEPTRREWLRAAITRGDPSHPWLDHLTGAAPPDRIDGCRDRDSSAAAEGTTPG